MRSGWAWILTLKGSATHFPLSLRFFEASDCLACNNTGCGLCGSQAPASSDGVPLPHCLNGLRKTLLSMKRTFTLETIWSWLIMYVCMYNSKMHLHTPRDANTHTHTQTQHCSMHPLMHTSVHKHIQRWMDGWIDWQLSRYSWHIDRLVGS